MSRAFTGTELAVPDADWIFVVDRLNTHLSESLVKLVAERCGVPDTLGKKPSTAS